MREPGALEYMVAGGIASTSDEINTTQSEATMDKSYAYALTPVDRALAWKWLLGMTAFYGTIALAMIGIIAASRYLGVPRPQESAAVSSAAPAGDLTCAEARPASGAFCSIRTSQSSD
jgi:hypothetical protein